jgi:hypothetical protein
MHRVFEHRLKETLALVLLGSFLAGTFGAVFALSAAASAPIISVTVDRTNKGDRLPYASTSNATPPPNVAAPTPPKRPPLGCDPAFSPVADPARALIYLRCMA